MAVADDLAFLARAAGSAERGEAGRVHRVPLVR